MCTPLAKPPLLRHNSPRTQTQPSPVNTHRPHTSHAPRCTKLPARSPHPRALAQAAEPPTPLALTRVSSLLGSQSPANPDAQKSQPTGATVPHLTHPPLARQFCASTTDLTHKLHELSDSTTPFRSATSSPGASECTKLPTHQCHRQSTDSPPPQPTWHICALVGRKHQSASMNHAPHAKSTHPYPHPQLHGPVHLELLPGPVHKIPRTPTATSPECLAHPSPDKKVHAAGKAPHCSETTLLRYKSTTQAQPRPTTHRPTSIHKTPDSPDPPPETPAQAAGQPVPLHPHPIPITLGSKPPTNPDAQKSQLTGATVPHLTHPPLA